MIPEDTTRDDIQQGLATDVVDSQAISSAVSNLRLKLFTQNTPLSEMAKSMEEIADLMKDVNIQFREVGGGDNDFKLTNTIEFEPKEIEIFFSRTTNTPITGSIIVI